VERTSTNISGRRLTPPLAICLKVHRGYRQSTAIVGERSWMMLTVLCVHALDETE
jgi:hypothetical protein